MSNLFSVVSLRFFDCVFFKQKTANDLRISDWSSDVCSSDLQAIAFAQTYFAYQTRHAELIEQRFLEAERVSARHKLTKTEKELSGAIYEQTGDRKSIV